MKDDEFKYTKTHEWAAWKEGGETILVGITDYGQQQLSDLTNVELPEPGDEEVEAGTELGVVESVKAASDYYAPVAGVIVAVNETLLDQPELVNEDPTGGGWLVEMKPSDPEDLDALLTGPEYDALLPDED